MKQLRPNPTLAETEQITVKEGPIDFIIQIQQALQTKQNVESKNGIVDAFAIIQPEEVVADLGIADYHLVFNKFNVAVRHYLLVAKHFVHELELLDSRAFEAIEQTHEVVRLPCFFNGGRLSGSSQPRRHLQFVQLQAPLNLYVSGLGMRYGECRTLDIFAGTYNGVILLRGWSAAELYSAYTQLLAFCHIRLSEPIFRADVPEDYPEQPIFPEMAHIERHIEEGMCEIALDSYSLMISDSYMFMCNRCDENCFNSISFSGSIFVKSQQLCDGLIKAGVLESLRKCIRPVLTE